jgi:Sulfatase
MQPSIYHQGLMDGETPNIDRIGQEGAKFMTYYAEQSCTAGRNAFFTGMNPLRTGMIPPQLPGSPSYLRPGTPALAKFLIDLGYNTGEFGKNHLGDHTDALPTAHGFQEFWGYLYHLDAMQQVSFLDINKTPTEQGIAPPCKNTPIPGLPEVPGAVDPKTTTCLTPPRNVLWCKSSDGSSKNQTCQDQGPLTLERTKGVDEEISAKVIDFLDRNDPRRTKSDRGGQLSGDRQDHPRWCRSNRLLVGKERKVRARHLLLLFRSAPVGRALQKLEAVFRDRA